MYTLLYLKQITNKGYLFQSNWSDLAHTYATNKDLLYSTRNCAQYYVTASVGKGFKKEK